MEFEQGRRFPWLTSAEMSKSAVALGTSALMVMVSLRLTNNGDSKVSPSLPLQETDIPAMPSVADSTSPIVTTTLESKTTTSVTSRPEPVPIIPLEDGLLADGVGMRIDGGHSWAVDCVNPATPESPTSKINAVQLPLGLNVRTSVLRISKDTVYFGEQTGPRSFGDNSISHGWAFKYNSSTNSHSVYRFVTRPKAGSLYTAEALGTLIKDLSLNDLQTGLSLEDETMKFSATIDNLNSAKPLHLSISCK